MKRLHRIFLTVVGLLLSLPGIAGTPVTGGAFTNPAINTILVDTGQLSDNNHEVTVMVSSTVAAVAVLEYRNAANDANVWSQYIILPANGFATFRIDKFTVSTFNERIRLRLNAAITGSIQASILID